MIATAVLSCSQRSLSQSTHRVSNRQLETIHIDTLKEEVLIVDKRVANLYFKKSDIKEFINQYDSLDKDEETNFPYTLELLKRQGSQRLVDWWHSYTAEERKNMFGEYDYSNEDKKYMTEFFFLAPYLLRDGKFMIVDKRSGEVIREGLKLENVKDQMGTTSIMYRMPDDKSFWYEFMSFGE